MKTWIIVLINQNGDKRYFYPKSKNIEDAILKGSKEALRISNIWNTYIFYTAELFNQKLHARY